MPSRRRVLQSLALLPLASHQVAKAAWPDKPLRLIVPSAAGGAPDVICRVLGAELASSLGQAVVIDNKPGASGNIARAAARPPSRSCRPWPRPGCQATRCRPGAASWRHRAHRATWCCG